MAMPRSEITTGIVGGSGFTGTLLAELLVRHPDVELSCMSSTSRAGMPVSRHAPRLRTGLAFCRDDEVAGVDCAFVCLPAREAAPVVKRLHDEGTLVVDLSPDFRLPAQAYAQWYGEHPFPELLPAVYGLPELHRDEIREARIVANPGCYPTAALLALEPLRGLGLLDIVIDAKSGASGAGKAPSERTHFCTVDSDLTAYGVNTHRHYPEIAAGLGVNGHSPHLTFVPHLAPLQRGIVETIYARVGRLPAAADLLSIYGDAYRREPFIEIVDEPPRLHDVVNTNFCRIFATVDERAGRVVVIAALDNLMKGASGQAVQNMNILLGRPEHHGLL